MFATGLIVFRETLEAALFVGIVTAATRGLALRSRWIAGGVGAGLLGALLLAAGMERVSVWADGIGQDFVNLAIISLALLMLAWHCIWISTHARDMTRTAARLGSSALDGSRNLWALSLAVGLSVLREGAETVLFVAGFMTGTESAPMTMLTGATAGLLAGVLVGVLLYLGLAHIRTRHLFSVTNTLMLVLAGSLASQLAKALIQAGLVERWSAPVWDLSALLSNDSGAGMFLHALMGYDARPAGLQLLFYACAMALIWWAARHILAAQKNHQGGKVTR